MTVRRCRNVTVWNLFLGFAVLGILLISRAQADVFYAEATIANTEGYLSGMDDWFSGNDGSTGGTPASGVSTADNKWRFRTNQGSGAGMWEATSSSTQPEDAVQIKTTVTGAPNGTYDVYVFYLSDPSPANWQIKAGLTPDPTTIYDRSGADGVAGLPVFTGATPNLTFVSGTQPSQDAQQTMLYQTIGQATVTDGTFSVYIDDLPTSSLPGGSDILARRTWYDGIGYFVPSIVPIIDSAMSGLHTTASTWTNNQPASSGNEYRVLSTHTVTVDSDFLGNKLTVTSGGVVDFSASAVDVRSLVVEAGGNITESVSGNFFLGDISAATLGVFNLQTDLSFGIDSGAEFGLDMTLLGPGNIDFNAGTDSTLYISAAEGHGGTIRFNGDGGEVQLLEEEGFHFLEMNAAGATVIYDPQNSLETSSKLTFNQPGTILHASEAQRLQGVATLVLNADVTLDLSQQPAALEKRFLTSAKLEGASNLHVIGTSTAPTSTGLNEYELGSQGTTENEPANLLTSPMSGTVTIDGYVNVEIRQHMPNASFVVNNHAVLEMGHMKRVAVNSIRLGSIEVNTGGVLEVGMEKSVGVTNGHFAYHLTLDDSGGKSGGLTLHDGAQLNMQINGDPTELTLFDRITADGAVMLDGTLRVFVNPDACIGNQSCLANMSYDTGPTFNDYVPNPGDTWDIINTTLASPQGDYNLDGSVNDLDHTEWMENFGTTNTAADGNGDSFVDAADYIVWRKNFGATGTAALITGMFDSIVDDLDGFHFEATYLPGKVSITLVADGAGSGAAVPEPSTLVLAGMMLCMGGMAMRKRR